MAIREDPFYPQHLHPVRKTPSSTYVNLVTRCGSRLVVGRRRTSQFHVSPVIPVVSGVLVLVVMILFLVNF